MSIFRHWRDEIKFKAERVVWQRRIWFDRVEARVESGSFRFHGVYLTIWAIPTQRNVKLNVTNEIGKKGN